MKADLLTASEVKNRVVEVKRLRFADVANHPLNPKFHPDNQRLAFRGSVREVGFTSVPVAYVSEAGVLTWCDGHLRGSELADYVGDVAILDISDAEAAKILAYQDPIAALAELDKAKLDVLLRQVNSDNEAIQGMLASMAAEAGLYVKPEPAQDPGPQIDKAAELQEKWQVEPGDLWQIGQHYIICGDCRQPETWQRLLSAAGVDKVNGVFTSPPYAMQRKDQYGGVPTAGYVEWWEAVQAYVKANLASDGSFFVNIKENSEDYIRQIYVYELAVAMVKRWEWAYLDVFCWERAGIPGDPFKMGKFKNQWEPVYWWSTVSKPKFNPDRVMHSSESTVLDDNYEPTLGKSQGTGKNVLGERNIGKGMAYPGNRLRVNQNDEALGHAAVFPVALPDFFVRAYSDPGDVWCDPFCGSGTSILAAHNNNRVGLGIEKLPPYCAVILERLSTVTGQTPTLADHT